MTRPKTGSDSSDSVARVGVDTSIAVGCVIDSDAEVGSHTVLGTNVTIGGSTAIGDNVTIDTGARVLANTTIADHVTVGANAVVGSRGHLSTAVSDRTIVGNNARVGAGAVVGAGLTVGPDSIVRPGAVVSTDVPAHAIVAGNPAYIQGYANAPTSQPLIAPSQQSLDRVTQLGVGACELWELPNYRDLRGSLVPLEHETDLPFVPSRTFFVFDVPGEEVRGEHAHRACAQFLIAVHGSLSVVIDDGHSAREVQLDRPSLGLLIPAAVWGVQYRFRSDGVLAVHASHPYDSNDYIRDYSEFLTYARTR